MLQVNNLSLSFGPQELLESVSFNIHAGERIGLIGRNGSGKTSLFKVIAGELEPDSGTVMVPRNYSIGYLKQHLKFTEDSVLKEACLGLKEDEKQHEWKAEKMLMGLGFGLDDQKKHPSLFSGGFQVRLNLAKVLLSEPHLLLLDEPTNYLDIISMRWLAKFLRQRERELIIITHDRDFMNSVTTHTMAIHRKKIKKLEGGTEKMFSQIAAEETVYEQSRLQEEKKRKQAEEFINRFRAQATRASMVQSRIKALDRMGKKKELEAIAELGFKFAYSAFEAKCPLRAYNLRFGYEPGKMLIDGFSIDVNKDDRICVIGRNGKGKSTLLRLLAGELTPVSGEVKRHPACNIGYFGQTNIERLDLNNTIVKEYSSLRPDLKASEIRSVCGAMMFTGDLALKQISVLSGGEKSRVMLGKILLKPANLLLLDEPTNHLDMESCDSLITALDVFPGAVIIVTHGEMFLHHLANRLIVFDNDEVLVFEGTYQDFLERKGWKGEGPAENSKDIVKEVPARRGRDAEAERQKKKIAGKIAVLESRIDEIQKAAENANNVLAEACVKGDKEEIRATSEEAARLKKQIEFLYGELEKLIESMDKV
ncbi:MAG TPA: ABC-F family ATP-binding cassette domain-containing protein [Candidatus Goldiibacteriota bacterium]|nr:ABC-F family ATP-binding cassette domain-containing protein [Candidatus Goldiibacteriota bacterium]